MTCSFAAARGFRMLLELTCKIKLPHSAVSVCLSVSLFLQLVSFFFVYFPFLPPSPSLFLRMCLCLCISLFCLYVPTYANISTYLYTSPSANLPIYRRIYQSHSPLPPPLLLLSATSSRGTDDHGEPPIRHDKVQTLRNMTSVL